MIGFWDRLRILPRFFYRILQGRGRNTGDEIREEFWETDFSKPGKTRFDIKSENAYDAYLLKGAGGKTRNSALALGLKKSACLAWVEGSGYHCGDMVLKARLRLDCKGGYGAAGIIFRQIDEGTYYMVLLSSGGHFRLDVVRNNTPLALIGWTECDAPASAGAMELTIIARGARMLLLINGRWAGEIDDASIAQGHLSFALASYRAGQTGETTYVAEAFLDYLSVDTRVAVVEARAWDISTGKNPVPRESRLRLAGTFAAMGQSVPALVQLQKLWESSGRGQEDLLLAARLAQVLEHYDEAEEYIGAALALSGGDPANSGILAEEKAKILYARGRRTELRDYVAEVLKTHGPSVVLLTLLGHAFWELGNYQEAGSAYDRAFELDSKNGLLAANAANVYDLLGEREKALDRYLAAGRSYLEMDNYGDLGTLIPKILALGRDRWEAHALAGKWAFGIEDWETADKEFKLAGTLQKKAGIPAKDPALCFLRGLLLIRQGKRRKALPLLEEAARLAPDYGLFYFRLAETRYLLDNNPADPRLRADLEKALSLSDEAGETWGWANNLAAQLSLAEGNTEAAAEYLEKAATALGERPPVLVNRAVYQYLRGFLDKALAILDTDRGLDTEGLMANCAGNLLVRSERLEEAHTWYQRALAIAPDNQEFLINCASCLIKMGQYGEADTLLARAHSHAPSPAVLELITYVAVKKGEYYRAESACNAALELDSAHVPSLRSLGWLFCTSRRWDEAGAILARLEALTCSEEDVEHREELQRRILEGTTQLIPCAACGRTWRIPLDPPPVSFLRLVAMPPDEIPAGTCPSCGTSYCIGCAKEHVDTGGRFTCPNCGKPLKLINEGLKKIVADWAAGALPDPPSTTGC
ncbi:MAG: tetratricopeptide repeat protein [Treponema sp.]|jgi:tetratricopeptide (TPR) repeat protein|nr:tetratricopeptide repeat protein [Treponema sp.]